MICKHQFIKAGEVSKLASGAGEKPKFTVGIEAVCVNCGQVRHAFADGTVVVKVEGGAPIDEDVSPR